MHNLTLTAFPLRSARVHEVCGPAAVSFALRMAQQTGADLIWVREEWQREQINPLGFDGFDPARLMIAQTKGQTETLAVAEEALRDGAIAMVVLEISAPLSLTAGRRLQLAAAAGGTTGLCHIPEGMGCAASETRWHCAPVFDESAFDAPLSDAHDSTLQRWELIKNKTGTLGSWDVRWDAEARRIAVVSPDRQRPGSAGAPD